MGSLNIKFNIFHEKLSDLPEIESITWTITIHITVGIHIVRVVRHFV